MKIERNGVGAFLLHANEREMVLINNAINEVCHGIRLEDFEIRVGVPIAEAQSVLKIVSRALTESELH